MGEPKFNNIINDLKFTVKLPVRLAINTISNYYKLQPQLEFQLEREKTDNLILRLLLKRERNQNNKLKFKLQKQTEELKNKNICSICLDRVVSICCIPCGHTYCNICVSGKNYCFICRKTIISTNRIYL
jgi:hypothetical protein